MTARPRILVVDDSATARTALEVILEERFEVHLATDGELGVALAQRIRPHLVLMDVVMPVMGGLDACRALRALPETSATPVIMVTSQGDEWDVEAGYTSGCADYVTKPVDRVELMAKVGNWLGTVTEDATA